MNLFGNDNQPELPGMKVLRNRLGRLEQETLVHTVLTIAAEAKFYTPTMKNGTPFRVQRNAPGRGRAGH